jgi:hypothetical protein
MPLIDSSYINTPEREIPNADKPEVNEAIDYFIEKYEPRFLSDLLGDIYDDYTTGLNVIPIDAKWTALKAMPELKNAIANYVYYWYMRNKATETTGIGEVTNKAENARRVSGADKMAKAWNEMVEDVWKVARFLGNGTTYTGWTWYGSDPRYGNYGLLKDIFYPINAYNFG